MRYRRHGGSLVLAVVTILLALDARFANAIQEPAQKGPATRPQIDPNLPTLFIIGDSTVHNPVKGEEGWGDAIKTLFDQKRINVVNRAIGGRSSRTFRTEGHWKDILDTAKPGDFVLMQFGHNDSGSLDDPKARGSLPGTGADVKTVTKADGSSEIVHTFGWYMDQYVTEAKAKRMTPIVCSYIPRCPRGANGKPATMPGIPVAPASYALFAKEIAEKEQVEFINLNGIIWQHYAAFTPDELKKRFFTDVDYTHTSPAGAQLNAQSVVEGIGQLKDCPLEKYLLPAVPNALPIP